MKKNYLLFCLLSWSILCFKAKAHRPIFSEKPATSPESAVIITEPDVSQVIYREITENTPQVWLVFDVNEGSELFIQIGIPVLERLKNFRPAMMVIGPGLPKGDFQIEIPNGMGGKDFSTDDFKEPRFFHEHFTGTDSWILRSETIILPNSGRYYVLAYVPSKENGKLWLSIGKKEVFGAADLARFGEWKKRIRRFHEAEEMSGGVEIPILSELFGLLKSADQSAQDKKVIDPCEAISTEQGSKYLNAVRTFADNVLKYGRDTYGPKHTPLFVDGLNIHTHEPVKWIAPNGDRWILSNLASQQNLFRTLDGLTTITGDPKYRQAAMEAIRYSFDHLRADNGLLYWGHSTAYDALRDKVWGSIHCLKIHYPHYELTWKVDPKETEKFIEAYWSAHVIDWSNLDFDRLAQISQHLQEPWNYKYKGGPTFFKSKISGACANYLTGSSLVQAGVMLYKLSGEEQPLIWSERLVKRFIDTRNPKTGISAFMYNRPWLQLGEDMKEHFVDPYTTVFPWDLYEWRRLYYPENAQAHSWMSIFLAGELLGEEGKEFTQWALEELTAWGRASYRKKDNCFVPMLTDGTNLEGYVWEEGPGHSSGLNVIKPYFADSSFFWVYSLAYCLTGDKFMWQMARDIALGNDFGDIGQTPADNPSLQTNTTCSNAYGVFGFLELYDKTKKAAYLETSHIICDNILTYQFNKGFFVPSKDHIYTRFDCFEPLALLHLIAVIEQKLVSVPQAWPSCPLFVPAYRHKGQGIDRRDIYTLTETSEPPVSLQEAAAIGDITLVRTLLGSGIDVESVDEDYLKTALHRAAMSGHKDVAILLLSQGADVNARDWFRRTPLQYAIQRGHTEIVRLLRNHGAKE